MSKDTVQVDIDLINTEDFYQSALTRLSYLYPSLDFKFENKKIFISNVDQQSIIINPKLIIIYS